MAGTKEGGARAAATNKAKYGSDFYARIGSSGGKVGRTGGFYANRDLARKAGAMGGRISRRGKSKKASTSTGASAVVTDNSTDE
jgi:hypothetical protein